jgi:hypothetical protein
MRYPQKTKRIEFYRTLQKIDDTPNRTGAMRQEGEAEQMAAELTA